MFNKVAKKNLLAVATAYAKATDLSLGTVSQKFYGKQSFFADLKRGTRSVTLDKLESMLEAFGKAWPENTPIPELEPAPMNLGKKVQRA